MKPVSKYFGRKKNENHQKEGRSMPDALTMLRADHRKVQDLFKRFEEAEESENTGQIKEIVAAAIQELKVHADLEEEMFYPAVRGEIEEEEKVDEAEEEHHVARLLISELEGMDPEDERYCAKFQVLAESVRHHIEEEESEVIPEVESSLDTQALGARMAERKQELQQRSDGGKSSAQRKKRRGAAKTKRK
jgi:hemerythrin-like domain-containing protein